MPALTSSTNVHVQTHFHAWKVLQVLYEPIPIDLFQHLVPFCSDFENHYEGTQWGLMGKVASFTKLTCTMHYTVSCNDVKAQTL